MTYLIFTRLRPESRRSYVNEVQDPTLCCVCMHRWRSAPTASSHASIRREKSARTSPLGVARDRDGWCCAGRASRRRGRLVYPRIHIHIRTSIVAAKSQSEIQVQCRYRRRSAREVTSADADSSIDSSSNSNDDRDRSEEVRKRKESLCKFRIKVLRT